MRYWRQAVIVLVVSVTLGGFASSAYGLSGAASSQSGADAAAAQYRSNPPRGSLPFTGFTVVAIALFGAATLGAGLCLRRVRRDNQPL